MSLKHILLGLIEWEPRTGYDLNKMIGQLINYLWTTDQSRVYRALYQMEEDGWVVSEQIIQEDSPNKKVYDITPIGKEELVKWLADPTIPSNTRNTLLAKIQFARAIPVEDQIEMLEHNLESMKEDLKMLEDRAEESGMMPLPRGDSALVSDTDIRGGLALEYGVLRMRFEVEWLESALRKLYKLT